jgi:hypothetical protein
VPRWPSFSGLLIARTVCTRSSATSTVTTPMGRPSASRNSAPAIQASTSHGDGLSAGELFRTSA